MNNVEVYLRYESRKFVFFMTFTRIRFLESLQNLCLDMIFKVQEGRIIAIY